MRIVFMGTPDFAAASLRALLDAGEDVVAVFTQADKPRGRGMKVTPSPVKALALEHGLPVYQPDSYRDGTATELLRSLDPDLLVVVAFGRILPEEFLRVAKKGSINVHASLLPRYRGSAPIQWAVLNGDRETGVSIQYMEPEVDSGDVVASRSTEIGEFETSGELFDRLMEMGGALLAETVRAIDEDRVEAVPQDESEVSFTVQLDKSMSPIDWNGSPRSIVKHICGMDPWPGATMELDGVVLRVWGAEYTDNHTKLAPGSVVAADNRGLEMACAEGETLLVTTVQAPGKKRMASADYLRGHPLKKR